MRSEAFGIILRALSAGMNHEIRRVMWHIGQKEHILIPADKGLVIKTN